MYTLSNHPLLISFMIVAKSAQNALCPSCDVIQDIIYILCGVLSFALFIPLYTVLSAFQQVEPEVRWRFNHRTAPSIYFLLDYRKIGSSLFKNFLFGIHLTVKWSLFSHLLTELPALGALIEVDWWLYCQVTLHTLLLL